MEVEEDTSREGLNKSGRRVEEKREERKKREVSEHITHVINWDERLKPGWWR